MQSNNSKHQDKYHLMISNTVPGPMLYSIIGWSDFEEKKSTLSMYVVPHLKQNSFFNLFKSENRRESKKNSVYYFLDKKPFCPFLKRKRFDFFKVSVIFWKWKLCRALVAEIADFLELNSLKYMYLIDS